MEKYRYVKKLPEQKVYKSQGRLSRYIHFLGKNKKRGVFFILTGILLFAASTIPSLPVFTPPSQTIINPVPLDVLAQGIQEKNLAIDQKNPLNTYVPSSTNIAIDTSYDKYFYLSFPSLNLKQIKVKANVDSADAKTYEKVLSQSVAHFKGTPLPGEGGNTFIYGHSSVVWFHHLYPYSYEGIFTSLFDLKIGDPITIDFKDHIYQYVVEGISTINANDFAQVQNINGVNTLTLMTCSPPGVGDKRLVIKAIQM